MSIIIKLQGLPLEATSVDVRSYFLGLTIIDGGVHIVGGDEGTVFIEFASDEDARQAMARGDGTIKNSNIKLLLSSRSEMQFVTDAARLQKQQYLQQLQQFQQLQQLQLQTSQPQPQFQQPLPPQYHQTNNLTSNTITTNSNNTNSNQRARMSGMRGGDDKLFADRRCVLAASNIPYRATSDDIIEFLSEFSITEDRIRRRYNGKGQPTADAKIAFPTPDAAMKALKMMNKKSLCGRPVFLKPV